MSADKYPSIFSRQMEAIVYIYVYLSGTVELSTTSDMGSLGILEIFWPAFK